MDGSRAVAGSVQSPSRQRRLGWLALLLGVIVAHLWVADAVVEDRFGWGQGERMPRRIEVTFVKELAQAAAAAPAVFPGKSARPAGAPRLAAVASAPAPAPVADLAPAPPAAPVPLVTEPPATQAPKAEVAASAVSGVDLVARVADAPQALPVVDAAAVSVPVVAALTTDRQTFEWPPSTRLTYLLTGNYRGPVEGRAQVEWLRSGMRYQVSLEASVTPLMSRRMTSEGEITDQGLSPRLLTGEQKVLLRAPRRWSLKFGPQRIVLSDGREVDTLPGAQDEASQFVQLTWIFTTQPQLLAVGNTVEMPLALSRRLDLWVFEVVAQETLQLPFGDVATFHVKPRRDAKGGDMTAQMWIAPSLQYLPVRILIRQDEQTFVDLMLEKAPLQAAR